MSTPITERASINGARIVLLASCYDFRGRRSSSAPTFMLVAPTTLTILAASTTATSTVNAPHTGRWSENFELHAADVEHLRDPLSAPEDPVAPRRRPPLLRLRCRAFVAAGVAVGVPRVLVRRREGDAALAPPPEHPALLSVLIGEIRVPTLIIQGRHDRARTPEHGAAMRDRIPGSRLKVLKAFRPGHTPQLEEPEAFHALALPFLRGGP